MRRHSSKPELPGSITSSSTQSTCCSSSSSTAAAASPAVSDAEAGDAEEVAQQRDDVGLVLDHQDRRLHQTLSLPHPPDPGRRFSQTLRRACVTCSPGAGDIGSTVDRRRDSVCEGSPRCWRPRPPRRSRRSRSPSPYPRSPTIAGGAKGPDDFAACLRDHGLAGAPDGADLKPWLGPRLERGDAAARAGAGDVRAAEAGHHQAAGPGREGAALVPDRATASRSPAAMAWR